ncbi:hypothetical protein IscW_ISCW001072, partial [Ixodes scapularis]
LPSVTALTRSAQRARRAVKMPLPAPQRLEDINFPTWLEVLPDGQSFLLYDSGAGDSDRLFLFATDKNLQLLSQYTNWFADGTFDVSPSLFHQ